LKTGACQAVTPNLFQRDEAYGDLHEELLETQALQA
jgi:hypothetical protein